MYPKHTNCLLCNSDKLQELNKYASNYLVKCGSCHFVFCQRIPTGEELTAHYNSYKRDNYISPITIKRYNELLDTFEKYRKTNNIIDIGCGDGYFLEVAKKRGWNVYGTEYTDAAIDICRKKSITVHQGILKADNYKNNMFDVVTSFEVIEHINNPIEEVKNIKAILRKGGALYITTPNFNSLSRFILGPKWNVIEYPEHLSYYTASTITAFFNKNNFEEIFLITSGLSLSRFNKSMHSEIATTKPNSDEELRIKTETKPIYKLLKWVINTTLQIFKCGDSLKVLYEHK